MTQDRTAAILAVAANAAGVCTRSELIEAGLASSTISERVGSGFMRRVAAGLYVVTALATLATPLVLASRAHPSGAISRIGAGRLWGQAVPPARDGEPIEISVPRSAASRPRLPGVVVRRVRHLPPEDVEELRVEGGGTVRVTSPARTIVDLAGTELTDHRLRHLVQTEVVNSRVTLAEVAACLGRFDNQARAGGDTARAGGNTARAGGNTARAGGGAAGRGQPGRARLRRLLEELGDGEPMAESELERRLAALLGDGFRRQYRPPWYDGLRGVVDFAAPEAEVIVEADGRPWHTTSQAMADDRRRDRLAAANGWVVLRVTWRDVVERPTATTTEIAAVVADRQPDRRKAA